MFFCIEVKTDFQAFFSNLPLRDVERLANNIMCVDAIEA